MTKNAAPSTQEHLPIAAIQDGVVLMNDASVRAILKVEPINFELKSESEQNGIIYGYQAFLNSLDFPIEIVIHSKKLDLERYLIRLDDRRKNMSNDLLRIQIEDYVDFVRRLISIANIMSKRFYVVVSYSVAGGNAAPLGGLLGTKGSATQPLLYQDQFERYRNEAYNRANTVAAGLSHLGLKVSLLDTQKLIELFYGIYNPDLATDQRLTNTENLNAGVVSSENEVIGEPAPEPVPEPAAPAPQPEQTPTQTPPS